MGSRSGPAALEQLVALACRAPSIHNTQPWRWRVHDDAITLYADLDRALAVEDPDGRGLHLSCGAALQHLQWAARCHGLATEVRPPTARDRTGLRALVPLARVRLDRGVRPPGHHDDLALLHQRCTDRRRFTDWPVPDDRLQHLLEPVRRHGARARLVTDVAHRFRLETLLHRVDDVVALDAARTAEQAAWVGRSDVDGVPLGVLPTRPGPASRFAPGTLDDAAVAVGAGEGLVLLGSENDDPQGWLRTGAALGELLLEATRTGLSVVPVSQVVEIEPVRREIAEHLLGGAFAPHLLLRVGWQAIGRSDLPRTPRRPLADVLLG